MKNILFIWLLSIILPLFGETSIKRLDYANMVIDYKHNLIWQDDITTMTQIQGGLDAQTLCKNLKLGGNSDWEVPTLKELKTITFKGKSKPSIHPIFKYCANGNYISSKSIVKNSSSFWVLDFGFATEGFSPPNAPVYLRCVKRK